MRSLLCKMRDKLHLLKFYSNLPFHVNLFFNILKFFRSEKGFSLFHINCYCKFLKSAFTNAILQYETFFKSF